MSTSNFPLLVFSILEGLDKTPYSFIFGDVDTSRTWNISLSMKGCLRPDFFGAGVIIRMVMVNHF